ncbi:DUF4012 domain-containing protein [Iamia sp. SCSIO 61187]|uniref:DUF4012 domain-containing protein n=1 Tax=Iamia sp. SCSIO 61187 TaxID=2722752 RepID=UPI001C62F296|nr:DUF4012 domain-containing protein [Iamia sp. SCSIO 61187]QYG92346.1 DUF4012 domain-containing protein [Iamia sp. SCSIO 61187]
MTLAAGKARRWPVLSLPVAAVVLASGWTVVPALASAATAIVGGSRKRRERVWGAATAALALQSMLRSGELGPFGLPTMIVALAVTPVVISAYQISQPSTRRRYRRIAFGVAGATALVCLAYGGLVAFVVGDVDRATADARQGLTATREGETGKARAAFRRAATDFDNADSLLNAWWAAPTRAVPILSQHARALGGAASEGRELSVTADETLVAADYENLRYASGRFDLARIESVQEPLSRTLASLTSARGSLADDDSPWLLPPLDDALAELDAELRDAQDEGELASQAIEVAPGMLGADGPRHYFIAFVTPAELRGSGGFMGSWAEVTADGGQLRLTNSGPVRELYDRYPPDGIQLTGPEDYLSRFGPYVEDGPLFIGDFGYAAHFPNSAEVMAQTYPQVGGPEVDAVISIDPIALAALLEFTGPVTVDGFGQPLDADNAADFLLRDNYRLFPDSDTQNDALAQLVETTFDQLTTGDLPGPRRIADVLSPVTREGRLRMWSPNPAEQGLLARVGATGAFPEPRSDHDFLAVSSQNSGNNKIDVYQSRSIDYSVSLDDDGGLEATAAVTVRNDPPLDGSVPDYVVGNSQGDPIGTNRMLLSVHTPHLLKGATVDGSPVGIQSHSEGGYRVYTAEVVVPPGGETTLELTLSGAPGTGRGGEYILDLAPQPTVTSDELTVNLDPGSGEVETEGPIDVLGRGSLRIRPSSG